jgi:hypothetical protein
LLLSGYPWMIEWFRIDKNIQERDMNKEALAEKIKAHAKNCKIACKQALKIAEEEKIPSKEVGEMLNEMKIKVASCQLGCFP